MPTSKVIPPKPNSTSVTDRTKPFFAMVEHPESEVGLGTPSPQSLVITAPTSIGGHMKQVSKYSTPTVHYSTYYVQVVST